MVPAIQILGKHSYQLPGCPGDSLEVIHLKGPGVMEDSLEIIHLKGPGVMEDSLEIIHLKGPGDSLEIIHLKGPGDSLEIIHLKGPGVMEDSLEIIHLNRATGLIHPVVHLEPKSQGMTLYLPLAHKYHKLKHLPLELVQSK